MGRRADLHEILLGLCENVYFQPPNNVQLKYPAIVYQRHSGNSEFADNKPYSHTIRYQLTVIDRDADGQVQEQVARLPRTLRDRFYAADNLNHDVFNTYF